MLKLALRKTGRLRFRLWIIFALFAAAASAQVLQLPPGTFNPPLNTIRGGSGAPANTTGNNGDWYVDTVGKVLYGPKAAGVWPSPGIQLSGPTTKTYTQGFTNATTVAIAHNLGTVNIVPEVFDSSGNVIGYGSFTVVDANNATLTFAAPQSGTVRILTAITGIFTESFTNVTSLAIADGLNTSNPLLEVFDSSGNAIGYGSFTVTDANDATLTFAVPQSGRLVMLTE